MEGHAAGSCSQAIALHFTSYPLTYPRSDSPFQPAAVQRGAHQAGLDAQLQPDRVDIEIRAAMSSVVKYNHCGQQFAKDDRRRGAVSKRSACEYWNGANAGRSDLACHLNGCQPCLAAIRPLTNCQPTSQAAIDRGVNAGQSRQPKLLQTQLSRGYPRCA